MRRMALWISSTRAWRIRFRARCSCFIQRRILNVVSALVTILRLRTTPFCSWLCKILEKKRQMRARPQLHKSVLTVGHWSIDWPLRRACIVRFALKRSRERSGSVFRVWMLGDQVIRMLRHAAIEDAQVRAPWIEIRIPTCWCQILYVSVKEDTCVHIC